MMIRTICGCVALILSCSVVYAGAETISPLHLIDLDGQRHTLIADDARATAVVFLGTQCPISNRAIPTLNDLYASHNHDGTAFYIVVSDPTLSRKDVVTYRDQYKIAPPILFDSSGELAQLLKPTHTPNAFVIDSAGAIRYRGRIDDTFAALGKINQSPKSHDLSDAIDAVLARKPVANEQTDPVGCPFEAWNTKSADAKVTYTRDIAPIINANCVTCHRNGQIAPFPLTSYTDVSKRAKLIADVTDSRYMPPWKPAEDFGHFAGEHRLSDREIALLKAWHEAGAPEGDASNLPPQPTFPSGYALGKPDMIATMAEPFTVPADGRDIYRAFVVPLNIPNDCYVAGIEFKPGAPTVVHHCILYLDTTGTARKLDAEDPAPGYKSFGGPGFTPTGSLGGWAPGAAPALLPDGVGRVLRKGSDLVFQMHYHPDGREHQDQSSVAIYLQKKPVTKVFSSFMLATRQIDIPAGEANYARDISVTLPCDVTVIGVVPHMHLIGREMKVEATTPDKKQIPLIWIKDWDFKWQGQYQLASPLTLTKGTTLTLHARYDNSTDNPDNPNNPPARVTHGEQTTDEMCICFVDFLANSQQEAAQIRRQVTRELVASAISRRLGGDQ
jgi:hypothetical protein